MLKRRTAIISGGCGAVGRALGKKLSEEGYDIAALYFATPQSDAEAIIKNFAPGNHVAIRCDVRDGNTTTGIVTHIAESHGSIDACIHTAVDPIARKNLLDLDEATFKEQFTTGVFGGFNFLQAAARAMQKQKSGAIVGILSKSLQQNAPHSRMAAYVIAKYALRGILRELFQELSPSGITVNAIAPDFMDTKLNNDVPREVREFIKERMPTESIASPEEVARIASFLCSNKGKSINGKIFSWNESEIDNL